MKLTLATRLLALTIVIVASSCSSSSTTPATAEADGSSSATSAERATVSPAPTTTLVPTATSVPTVTPTPAPTPTPTPTPEPSELLADAMAPFLSSSTLTLTTSGNLANGETTSVGELAVDGADLALDRAGQQVRVIDDRLYRGEPDTDLWIYEDVAYLRDDVTVPDAGALRADVQTMLELIVSADNVTVVRDDIPQAYGLAVLTSELQATEFGAAVGIADEAAEVAITVTVLDDRTAVLSMAETTGTDASDASDAIFITDLSRDRGASLAVPDRRQPINAVSVEECLLAEDVNTLAVGSCTQPHDARIYAEHSMPDAMTAFDYDEAERRCADILVATNGGVGLAPPFKSITMGFPSDAQWEIGGRIVECFITFSQQVTGPLDDLTVY